MQILGLLGMYFDAAIVFVMKLKIYVFRLALYFRFSAALTYVHLDNM